MIQVTNSAQFHHEYDQAVTLDTATGHAFRQSGSVNYLSQTSTAMWIPTPIYEALPYLYITGGVLFISGTLYIGITAPGAALYIACGLVSIVYGAFIFAKRHAHRNSSPEVGSAKTA